MRTCRHLKELKAHFNGAAVCEACLGIILKGLDQLKSHIVGNRMERANGTETDYSSPERSMRKMESAAASNLIKDLTL